MGSLTKENAFAGELEKAEEQLNLSPWMREYLAFHDRSLLKTPSAG